MNETTPKISVIVPVYKAEAYLHRCVDSLLAQTFTDFEILLVDDGSPDRSGEICDEYVKKDNRVKVYHKENGGVSSARNMGLDYARGEWITFVDSDDYVDITYLDDFGLNKYNAEFYLQGYVVSKNGINCQYHNYSTDGICSFEIWLVEGELKNILNSPCCKLFSRDLIVKHKIKFNLNISFGEDHLFVLNYILYIDKVATSVTTSYYYMCQTETSLTRRIVPVQELLYYGVESYQALQRYSISHKKCKQIIPALSWRTYSNMIITIKNYLKGKGDLSGFQEIKQLYKSMISPTAKGISSLQYCLKILFLYFPTRLSYYIFSLYTYIRP